MRVLHSVHLPCGHVCASSLNLTCRNFPEWSWIIELVRQWRLVLKARPCGTLYIFNDFVWELRTNRQLNFNLINSKSIVCLLGFGRWENWSDAALFTSIRRAVRQRLSHFSVRIWECRKDVDNTTSKRLRKWIAKWFGVWYYHCYLLNGISDWQILYCITD